LCAIWVAYYHGFAPILSDKFDGVNISVDFFFMVSGLFFLKSIEKYQSKPFKDGLRHISWGKTKSFIVPLGIAALSILSCNIIFALDFEGFNWPLSFLWFFAAQFLYLLIFYLILRKIKRRSMFNIACGVIICISMSLFIFMPYGFAKQFDRVFRGPAMIALGILISQIPKIKIELDNKIRAEKITLALNSFGFVAAATAFIYLAYLPTYSTTRLHLFLCIVCTSLLYFATALPVKGRFFDFLGEISVFIYLAQCPILFNYYSGTTNLLALTAWLWGYVVVLFLINRLVRRTKLIV
jgi:peptidoglycan/LPS O-acetylase OafA/YrhL